MGELRFTKSGRGLMFVRKRAGFDEFLVCSKQDFDEFVKGDRAWVDFALVVGDHEEP